MTSGLSKPLRTVYRGQTREYAFSDGTVSLLTGRERTSTASVQKHSPWYNPSDVGPELFQEVLRELCVVPRRETKPFPFDSKRPKSYFELLLLQGLLQHYGLPTVCVDASADPLVALWFALSERERIPCSGLSDNVVTYRDSSEEHGVVYVLKVPSEHIGRGKRVGPSILTADLRLEVPNTMWRPWRQSAIALSQWEWGVIPGENWNCIAGCIVKRIVVKTTVGRELRSAMRERSDMNWLFPPCADDPIHRFMASGQELGNYRRSAGSVEWLIHPDYLWHFKWCREHVSTFECFLAQSGTQV
jgi:hypothetical protein